MEQQIIEILNTIKWPGAMVVFIFYGYPALLSLIDKKWVKNNLLPKAEKDLAEIKDNHLHELKDSLNGLGNKLDILNTTLLRMENTLNEHSRDALFIKAKLTKEI